MTTLDRLINWGLWANERTGPKGLPTESPMFRGANKSNWHDPAWGDAEAAPEEIPDPIDERDAEFIDSLIRTMPERLNIALGMEYGKTHKVFRFKRHSYVDSINEGIRYLTDLLDSQRKFKDSTRVGLPDPARNAA